MGSALMDLSQDTVAELQKLVMASQNRHEAPFNGDERLRRDITTALGLTAYDLQAPAKLIRPFVFVLLNITPRVPGKGDTATHWRSITGVNTTGIEGGVPEGNRMARITTTAVQVQANYATVGLEDSVSFEADLAAIGLEDLRARTALDLLYATKENEEYMALGGNNSLALGTPGTIALSSASTGGTVSGNQTIFCGVVALTVAGLRNAAVTATGVPQAITLTSPVSETITYNGGSSQLSAVQSISVPGGTNTNTVSVSVPAVKGAVGYAWYFGTTAGAQYIAAITPLNSYVLTANPVTVNRQNFAAMTAGTDFSRNALVSDGLLTQAFNSGYVTTLPTGTPGTGSQLTANGAGGIVEIDNILQHQWDANKTSPDLILVSSQEARSMNKLVVNNGGAPLFRFQGDMGGGGPVTAASLLANYFNMFTPDGGHLVKLQLHPSIPKGTVLFLTSRVPGGYFPGSNLGQLWEFHVQRDYYQLEWPLRTRAYETGVYVREVLAHYFPATLEVLNNVAATT